MYITLPLRNEIVQGLTCGEGYHDMHRNLQLAAEISEGGAECMAPVERFKGVVE